MKTQQDIFKYNTKNAGQQLLTLVNQYQLHIDEVSKGDILESMRQIGVHLLNEYNEHKDKFIKWNISFIILIN